MATLADIMTGAVYTCDASTPVAEVCGAMVKGRIGSAVVIENGWVAGIFTERDALRVAAAGVDTTTAPLADWMTRDPITVEADLDVSEALQIMATHGFRHLPVVQGKDLKGIVSLRDVLATKIARAPR